MLKIGTSPYIDKHFTSDEYKAKGTDETLSEGEGSSPYLRLGNRVKILGGGIQTRIKSIAGHEKPLGAKVTKKKPMRKQTSVAINKNKEEEEIDNFF